MSELKRLELLASCARPANDDDWGTQEQVEAENEFFTAVENLGVALDETFLLKGTTEENIDYALSVAQKQLGGLNA